MVIHLDNKDNETEVYHEDNSFNNQGVEPAQSDEMQDEQMQIPNQRKGGAFNNARDFAHGFKEGVKNGLNPTENNPALGINKKDKKNLNDNKNKNQQGNKNPAKGQQDKSKRKNPLPGGGLGDPAKRKRQQDNANNKNNQNQQNKKDKNGDNKNGGLASKLNPMNRRRQMLGGLGGKGAKGGAVKEGASQAGKAMLSALKTLWIALPIQAKVVVIGLALIPILILILIGFVGVFGGTTAAIVASMCSEEGGSTYNGEDYTGSADEKEFLCKMQNPLGSHFDYTVTSRPGPRWGDKHNGIDLAIAKGTPVYAVQAGVVTAVNDGCYDDEEDADKSNCGGETRGNYVAILHGGTIETHYYHMVKGSIKVKVGDKVGKGQLIGQVASSGRSTGYHLHFGMKINGTLVFNYVDYFDNYESFKNNCGSMWDGELAGDSANAANDTTDYVYTGSGSSDEECCVPDSGGGSSTTEYCPNGITVTGTDAGTYDLDEYVERVVTAENGGANEEALKALAVAARTYAINRTDNCEKTIPNSTAAQVMADEATDRVKQALASVKGAVMLYKGDVFSAEYSSFWGTCTSTTCTGRFRKVPSDEWETYTMPRSYYTLTGHSRGLSQNGSNYMAAQGRTYDEILEFFYAEDVEIVGGSGNTCEVAGNSFNGKIYQYYQTDYDVEFCGSQTISESGCVPTSMAVVVSSLLGEEHPPAELAEFGCDGGHCSKTRNSGCSASLLKAAADEYGLNYSSISVSKTDEILAKLNGGNTMFIAFMKPGLTPFANTATHAIVIYGADSEGNVSIWDPYESHGVNNKTWALEEYFNSETVSGMYMFSKK